MIQIRTKLDSNLSNGGKVIHGRVQVVGQQNVLCIVEIDSFDTFTIPLVGGYFYHRLFRLPFVNWTSFDVLGQEDVGLNALVDFISTNHVIPKAGFQINAHFSKNYQFETLSKIPGNTVVVSVPTVNEKRTSPEPSTVIPPKEIGYNHHNLEFLKF